MPYVLVTGATGFAGAYIVHELLSQGYRVRAMLRESSPASVLAGLDVGLFRADLSDTDSLREAVKGVDHIVHPAYSIEGRVVDDPIMEFEINERGSPTLLEAARHEGVESFIFTSSGASVGYRNPTKWQPVYPIEETSPCFPTDVYGAGKAAVEKWCFAYYHQYGLKTVTLRTMWVYGAFRKGRRDLTALGSANNAPEGKSEEAFIRENDFLGTFFRYTEQALKGEDITVPGGGFHMTHVEDLARAHRLAIEKSEGGEIYNVNDDHVTWRAFIERVVELTGSKSRLTFEPPPANDVFVSNVRIREKMGMTFKGMAGLDDCIYSCMAVLVGERK